MRGKMKMDLVDIQIFLFDHLIVFCKIKNQEGLECYKIYQKVFTKTLHTAYVYGKGC